MKIIENLKVNNFTDEEIGYLMSFLTVETYKKNEIILRKGQSYKGIYFINKGIVKLLHIINGEEKTFAITCENEWVLDPESYMSNLPSNFKMEAVANAELYFLSYEAMAELAEKTRHFYNFTSMIFREQCLYFLMRSKILQTKGSEQKYGLMMEAHPELINKVPLKYIADLISITPETLSRIRGKLVRNKNIA